jgi:hypothetical protein
MRWDTLPGVDGYIVFHWEFQEGNFIWYGIDTIFSDVQVEYTHITGRPDSIPEAYRIGELDTGVAGNWSGAFGEVHRTIHLTGDFDACFSVLNLQWTPYIGWYENLSEYEIFMSVDGGPFSLQQSLQVSDTSFTLENVEANLRYCFYVVGIHSNGTESSSNRICFDTEKPVEPSIINADFATVNDRIIDLRFQIDPLSELTHYRLLKRTSGVLSYDTLMVYDPYSAHLITAEDPEADTEMVWEYQLAAYNACGLEVIRSNIASNMVLEITNSNLVNYLHWSEYRDWLGGVEEYTVYRKLSGSSYVNIATLTSTDTSFADDISLYRTDDLTGEFCYYVTAEEGPGNPYTVNGFSSSNEVCFSIEPSIFLPNAIIPNSDVQENRVFKPVFTFAPGEYQMVIFDRWNNKVFETSSYQQGWDGMLPDGSPAGEGSYIYFIEYRSAEGVKRTRRGQVTILYLSR